MIADKYLRTGAFSIAAIALLSSLPSRAADFSREKVPLLLAELRDSCERPYYVQFMFEALKRQGQVSPYTENPEKLDAKKFRREFHGDAQLKAVAQKITDMCICTMGDNFQSLQDSKTQVDYDAHLAAVKKRAVDIAVDRTKASLNALDAPSEATKLQESCASSLGINNW